MQEIASPDSDGVEQEQGLVLNATERHHTFYYAVDCAFHLIVERQLLTDGIEGYEHGYSADKRHDIACGGEHSEYLVEACSCVRKEGEKHRYLTHKRDEREYQYQQGVNGTFRHHGSESLWE